MPGLLGAVQCFPEGAIGEAFDRVLAPMRRNKHLQTEMCLAPDGRWALGRVHLGVLQPTPQLENSGPIRVLFHGELHNEDELRSDLEQEGRAIGRAGVASVVRALYQSDAKKFVARIRGTFCLVVLDSKAKRVVLATDILGSYPVYWAHLTNRFVFASELKALLCVSQLGPTLDPRAVADFLTFGFLLGDKTLAAQARLLPPATVLTYSWEDDSYTLERYARLEDFFQPWEGTRAEYMEHLRWSFNNAVRRALAGHHATGLALSGGLDSRSILSALDGEGGRISTYTLGVKGCADEVIAEELAGLAGTQHRFVELGAEYLGEFLPNLRRMVALTDGMYMTHGLTEMLAMRFLEKAGIAVLLRGHGGELAKASLAWPFHTDREIFHMRSSDVFVSYLVKRLNYVTHHVSLDEVLTAEWAKQVVGEARSSLEEAVAGVDLCPPDLCSYLYVTELHRRFTIPSLELFRSLVEVRLPFLDTEFLRVLWRGPAQWRDSTELHRGILSQNHQALLRVRNSNTGAPAGAHPIVEKTWDKLNTLFKRLHVYGYRHYHAFERWMSEQLVAAVEEVLLEPKSLTRGLYRETTLRRLLAEARDGRADHAYLLQILLILELWQRDSL